MSKQRAVLDANVLYGGFLRDLLLSVFAAGLYEAKWTEEITAEWVRHLLKNRSGVTAENNARTVLQMHQIRPSALVENYKHLIESIDLPDKDDRHVVAAAIACQAQKIVTRNLRDFPSEILGAFGIVAQSPDSFLSELIRENAEGVVAAFRAMRKRFKKPPMSVNDFFAALEKHELALTAKQLAHLRDLL